MNKKYLGVGLCILIGMIIFYYIPLTPTLLPDSNGIHKFPEGLFFSSASFWILISLRNVIIIEVIGAGVGLIIGTLIFLKSEKK